MTTATAWRIAASLICSIGILSSTSYASGPVAPTYKCDPSPKPQLSTIQPIGGDKFDASFTWDQFQSGAAKITVWNDSATDQTVELHGGNLVILSLTPDPSDKKPINFEVDPVNTKIEVHHAVSFTLKTGSASPKLGGAGAFVGVVEIKSIEPAKDSTFQKIRITVTPARPAIAKARFIAWRIFPLFPLTYKEPMIPLTRKLESDQLPLIVGYLQGDRGWAPIEWIATKASSQNDGRSVAVLDFPGVPAGKYDGTINLAGLEETQTSITVVSKDIVLWPLIVIAIGIAIAWLAKRYVGVLRLTWGLRKLEAEIGLAFQRSQGKFSELSAGRSFASLSIAKSVAEKRAAIRVSLGKVEALKTTSITGVQDYTDAVNGIKSLQAQIAQWPQVAAAAVSLDDAIKQAESTINPDSTVPVGDYTGRPLILKNVQQYLLGQPISCDDIATRLKSVLDAGALVRTWQESNENAITVSKDYADLASLTNWNANQQAILDDVKARLIAMWTHLWTSADASAFASGPSSDLDFAIQEIRKIKPVLIKKSEFAPATFQMMSVKPAADHLTKLSNFTAADYSMDLPADDAQRVDLLQRRIDRSDLASIILASVIAVITGLNSNYWGDRAFGSFQDYAVLFLWAAGTKVGVDIIAAVVDKFISNATAT